MALGDHAAYVLKALHRAQITGLENIAESALKTSDVFDFIKKQIARFSYWRAAFPEYKENANIGFGERLKYYLEHTLDQTTTTACSHLGIQDATDADKQTRRHVYLLLMRQFLRQMAAEYEYQVSPGAKRKEQQP